MPAKVTSSSAFLFGLEAFYFFRKSRRWPDKQCDLGIDPSTASQFRFVYVMAVTSWKNANIRKAIEQICKSN
jgi:hypothetical protein